MGEDVADPPVRDPTDAERQLWAAFPLGELVDLRTGNTEVDDPGRANTWEAARRVRADVVTALILGAVGPIAGRVPRLRLAGALVDGTVDVRGGIVNYAIEMTGCHFTGSLLMTEARTRTVVLSDSVLDTIDASAAQISGHLTFRRCQVRTIDLSLAHISADVSLNGTKLASPGGASLTADGMTVDGGMFCREEFQAEGEVRLVGAHIRQLSLSGAKLASPGGIALTADGMTVDDAMFCRGGFQAEGEVRLVGAHIGGQLDLGSAKLANPSRYGLRADGITVGVDMFCQEGFQAEGEVRLVGAHIGGQLGFRGASLSNDTAVALSLQELQAESLWLDDTTIAGAVDLRSAQVEVLYDNPDRWPQQMRIDRFTYQSLDPYAAAQGTHGRLAWLERAEPGYRAQPYEQLAAYYRRLGHDEEARLVLLTKQRHRRATLRPVGKMTGYLLDGIVGYGYRPGRAFAWLMALLAAGSVYFTFNQPPPLDPSQHPHYQPVLYTAEQLIPLVNLSQSSLWAPAGISQWVAFVLAVLGWVLVTAIVAGVTRVLARV